MIDKIWMWHPNTNSSTNHSLNLNPKLILTITSARLHFTQYIHETHILIQVGNLCNFSRNDQVYRHIKLHLSQQFLNLKNLILQHLYLLRNCLYRAKVNKLDILHKLWTNRAVQNE